MSGLCTVTSRRSSRSCCSAGRTTCRRSTWQRLLFEGGRRADDWRERKEERARAVEQASRASHAGAARERQRRHARRRTRAEVERLRA